MTPAEPIPNILAARYASEPMRELWSPEHKVVLERRLWLAVLRVQRALGADIKKAAIDDYEAVLHNVDLASIAAREAVTRHDVKARIDEFCALAGQQRIHLAMTSRDLTENVEQMQILGSLRLIRADLAALLGRLADRAEAHASLAMTARTHNVAAQVTTLGKRFADAASETILGFERVSELMGRYPLRGLKGPVGTRADQLALLGTPAAVAELERLVAEHCGFSRVLATSAQVYPRSLDLDVVSALVQAVSAPASLALTLRLMAGLGLVSEGFRPGQVGSSAMPHKVNARSAERIGALKAVLDGHLAMAASLSGSLWNEGDVSCSAVRRVVLPDAFFAADGLLHTAAAVVDELEVFEGAISAELRRQLPLLVTARLLGALVEAGMGREAAHELVAEHARAVVAADRRGEGALTADGMSGGHDPLTERLAADRRSPLDREALAALISEAADFTGTAGAQVAEIAAQARAIVTNCPEASGREPEVRF